LLLEVRGPVEVAMTKSGPKPDAKRMVGYGWLVDGKTGSAMGEFSLNVAARNAFDMSGPNQPGDKHRDVIQLMAQATLEKVYGKPRSKKLSGNPTHYIRHPNLPEAVDSVQVGALRPSIDDGLSVSIIRDRRHEQATGEQISTIVAAPDLLVRK
jgi:hypothetical protein